MTNHCGSYGPGNKYSSFRMLAKRAGLPHSVLQWLGPLQGITGMRGFVDQKTLGLINRGHQRGFYDNDERCAAISVWNAARKARVDLRKSPVDEQQLLDEANEEYGDEEMSEEKMVNADRNEMVALLQAAKGAKFVTVHMQHSRLDGHGGSKIGPRLTYKAVGLDLNKGDYVIVQYHERLGIGVVETISDEAPTSDEYDYRQSLKHVVQKIDTDRAKQLALLDRQILQRITASEAQDRMERLTRQLGIAMDQITLELPKLED